MRVRGVSSSERRTYIYLQIVRSDIFIPQNIRRRRANYILYKIFVIYFIYVDLIICSDFKIEK